MKFISIALSFLILSGCACVAVVQIVKTIDFFKSKRKNDQNASNNKKGDEK